MLNYVQIQYRFIAIKLENYDVYLTKVEPIVMNDLIDKKNIQPLLLFERYKNLFKEIKVKSKTVLLKEGETANKIFFVKNGCLRMWLNHEGREITFQFFFENEMVASIESFMSNKPGSLFIETLEPSTLLILNKKDFQFLLGEITELKDFLMETAFKRFGHYSKLYVSFLKNNPAERYKELIQNEPRIIQRIPQQYIASYLGITPVSLSRIRNKIRL